MMGFWFLSSSIAHQAGKHIAKLTAVDKNATAEETMHQALNVFNSVGLFAIGSGRLAPCDDSDHQTVDARNPIGDRGGRRERRARVARAPGRVRQSAMSLRAMGTPALTRPGSPLASQLSLSTGQFFRATFSRIREDSRHQSPPVGSGAIMRNTLTLAITLALILPTTLVAAEPKPLKLLFLGDNGHHKPADRHRQLAAALAPRKIDVVYTDKADALSAKNLAGYDGLIVYANIDNITPEQETAPLDFVAGGKGFIPLHCASYCFRILFGMQRDCFVTMFIKIVR